MKRLSRPKKTKIIGNITIGVCCVVLFLQFPVKWNAFSDRNGMLFSGLTEWLSDTNGMAQ